MKINRTVFELWTGIVIYTLLCQIIAFFVNDPANYSICLWVGSVTAIVSAYHMWWTIDMALSFGEADAPKKMSVQYVIRYICLVIILGIMGVRFGNYCIVTFVGILGIKVSAYLHPITRKIANLVYGEEILPEKIEIKEVS